MTRMSLAERRHKLIEAALRVIGERGMAAATTRAIAAEAGMPLASFHYAFESHQNLMGEAMASLVGDELAEQRALQPRGTTVEDMVRSLLLAHLDDLVVRPDVHRTLMELGDYALRTEGLEKAPLEWREQRVRQLTQVIEKHSRQVGLHLARPAEDLAQYLQVLTDGLTRTYLTTGDETLLRAVVENSNEVGRAFAA